MYRENCCELISVKLISLNFLFLNKEDSVCREYAMILLIHNETLHFKIDNNLTLD